MAYAPNTPYINEPRLMDDAGNTIRSKPTISGLGQKNIYRGFSTFDTFGRNFGLSDVQLVNRDLLNHIYTIPGERIGHPEFGTLIPVIGFEQADQQTLSLVESELKKVINLDPRVELIEMQVMALPDNNAIFAVVDLRYIELDDFVGSLSLTINSRG